VKIRIASPACSGRDGIDPAMTGDDGELDRCPARVVSPDGVAIHRRVRTAESWTARQRAREHPAERRHDVDTLHRERPHA